MQPSRIRRSGTRHPSSSSVRWRSCAQESGEHLPSLSPAKDMHPASTPSINARPPRPTPQRDRQPPRPAPYASHPRYRIALSQVVATRTPPPRPASISPAPHQQMPRPSLPLPAPPAVPKHTIRPPPYIASRAPLFPLASNRLDAGGQASSLPPCLALRLAAAQRTPPLPASAGFSPASARLVSVPDFPPSPPACHPPHLQRVWHQRQSNSRLPLALWLGLAGSIISLALPPLEGSSRIARGASRTGGFSSRLVLPRTSPESQRASRPPPAPEHPLPVQRIDAGFSSARTALPPCAAGRSDDRIFLGK